MFSAFATLLLTSCTKNYSCKCVTVYHPSLGIGTTTQTINLKAKKRDAKATSFQFSRKL